MNQPFEFDPLLHHQTRFGIVTHLIRQGGRATWADVKAALGLKHPGSLTMRARALEEAGYISQEKTFAARRPRTTLVLTDKGRDAFVDHMQMLNRLAKHKGAA